MADQVFETVLTARDDTAAAINSAIANVNRLLSAQKTGASALSLNQPWGGPIFQFSKSGIPLVKSADLFAKNIIKAREETSRFGAAFSTAARVATTALGGPNAALLGVAGTTLAAVAAANELRGAYQKFSESDKAMRVLSSQMGKTMEQTAGLEDQFRRLANESGRSTQEVVAGFNTWRVRSGLAEDAAKRLYPLLVKGAVASNASISELGVGFGTLVSNLKVTEEEAPRVMDILIKGASSYEIKLDEMMRSLPQFTEELGKWGYTGVEGAAQLVTMLGVVQPAFRDAERSARALYQLMQNPQSSQEFLKKIHYNAEGLRQELENARDSGRGMMVEFMGLVDLAVQRRGKIAEMFSPDVARVVQRLHDVWQTIPEQVRKSADAQGALNKAMMTIVSGSAAAAVNRLGNEWGHLYESVGKLMAATGATEGLDHLANLLDTIATKLDNISNSPLVKWYMESKKEFWGGTKDRPGIGQYLLPGTGGLQHWGGFGEQKPGLEQTPRVGGKPAAPRAKPTIEKYPFAMTPAEREEYQRRIAEDAAQLDRKVDLLEQNLQKFSEPPPLPRPRPRRSILQEPLAPNESLWDRLRGSWSAKQTSYTREEFEQAAKSARTAGISSAGVQSLLQKTGLYKEATDFGRGGLAGVYEGGGRKLPEWLQKLADLFRNPEFVAALSSVNPLSTPGTYGPAQMIPEATVNAMVEILRQRQKFGLGIEQDPSRLPAGARPIAYHPTDIDLRSLDEERDMSGTLKEIREIMRRAFPAAAAGAGVPTPGEGGAIGGGGTPGVGPGTLGSAGTPGGGIGGVPPMGKAGPGNIAMTGGEQLSSGYFAPGTSTQAGGGLGGYSASMGPGKHGGDDYMMAHGSPVHAIKEGVISRYGRDNFGGLTMTVKHPDGSSTTYMHLSKRIAPEGSRVTGGQVIGLSGTANGVPHLHLEMRNRQGQRISPRHALGITGPQGQPQTAGVPSPTPADQQRGSGEGGVNVAGGKDVTGRMTWFNPAPTYSYRDPATGKVWTDTSAMKLREGRYASGLPPDTPGIATEGKAGLGGYYQVTLPDGRVVITRKVDSGPRGVVDLSGPLAAQAYPKGMPGGLRASAKYLGRNLPEGVTAGIYAPGTTIASLQQKSQQQAQTQAQVQHAQAQAQDFGAAQRAQEREARIAERERTFGGGSPPEDTEAAERIKRRESALKDWTPEGSVESGYPDEALERAKRERAALSAPIPIRYSTDSAAFRPRMRQAATHALNEQFVNVFGDTMGFA